MIDLWLLLAKYAFLACLYAFIFWALAVVLRDPAFGRPPHEIKAPARIRIVDSPFGPASYAIGDSAVIGRGPGSDVRLEDTAASAEHARLAKERRHWVIEDLESSNGTFVNGRRIRGKHRLAPGDRVKIGRTELTVEEG